MGAWALGNCERQLGLDSGPLEIGQQHEGAAQLKERPSLKSRVAEAMVRA